MEPKLITVDMTLNAGAFDLDKRAIPAGFIMMAIGLVGFVASFFRRKRETQEPKRKSRWGRG